MVDCVVVSPLKVAMRKSSVGSKDTHTHTLSVNSNATNKREPANTDSDGGGGCKRASKQASENEC